LALPGGAVVAVVADQFVRRHRLILLQLLDYRHRLALLQLRPSLLP
jgi:hypothetical protein